MAEKQNSLIGYDPLAWIIQTADSSQPPAPAPIPEPPVAPLVEQGVGMPEPETSSEVVAEAAQPVLAFAGEDLPNQTSGVAIKLASVQNLSGANELYQQLRQALDSDDTIEIDASEVTIIDTATLQMLVILKQSAIKQEKVLSIDFPSDRFMEAAQLLGIAELLDVDQAIAGFF